MGTNLRADDDAQASRRVRRLAWLALLLVVPIPSLGVACEMLWIPGPIGLSILGAGKVWILALPLWWTLRVEHRPLGDLRPTSNGLRLALLSGLIGAAAVELGYRTFLGPWIDPATLREMARANHLLEVKVYLAVAVYTCVVNSLLEEYVWRWFVFSRFERLAGRNAALFLAAAGFTLHHTLILYTQFGPRLAVVGSLGVFIAGLAWSFLFARTRKLYAGWLSHAIVDVAVFHVGWRILFG